MAPCSVTPIRLDQLASALDLNSREHIAIVGGGGKTTTLFALGAQLDPPGILTTTTKMGSERDDGRPVLIDPSDSQLLSALAEHERVVVWSERGDHRAVGVAPEDCDRWFSLAAEMSGDSAYVVVEADGSRGRPFKAPYHYEPVVPSTATLVIASIGASAIGRPIGHVCHRPDAVAAIVGATPDDPLTATGAAQVLLSEHGSRKSVPRDARFVVVVHQVGPADQAGVDHLASAVEGLAEGKWVPLIAVAAQDGLAPRVPTSPAPC